MLFRSTYLQNNGQTFSSLDFDMKEAELLRYRVTNVLESITKSQIKEAQKNFLKLEILNSEKLSVHFEENPHDLQILRHDTSLLPKRVDKSLSVIPDYLGKSMKRLAHPLTQKIKNVSKTSKKLGNIDSLTKAIKMKKQKDEKMKNKRHKR